MITPIEINSLRLRAYHGVFPQETSVGNIFEITMAVETDLDDQSIKSDSLEGTINYATLVAIIKHEMAKPSALIENVAYRLKETVIEAYPAILHGRIKIAKLLPPISNTEVQSIAVEIKW